MKFSHRHHIIKQYEHKIERKYQVQINPVWTALKNQLLKETF